MQLIFNNIIDSPLLWSVQFNFNAVTMFLCPLSVWAGPAGSRGLRTVPAGGALITGGADPGSAGAASGGSQDPGCRDGPWGPADASHAPGDCIWQNNLCCVTQCQLCGFSCEKQKAKCPYVDQNAEQVTWFSQILYEQGREEEALVKFKMEMKQIWQFYPLTPTHCSIATVAVPNTSNFFIPVCTHRIVYST